MVIKRFEQKRILQTITLRGPQFFLLDELTILKTSHNLKMDGDFYDGTVMNTDDIVLQLAGMGTHEHEHNPMSSEEIVINGTYILSESNNSVTIVYQDLDSIPLFQGYPTALLRFASVCCLLFMMVGIPGNLITIIALFRCKKLVAKVPCRIISIASIATDDGILYDVAHVTEWERNQMTRERRMSAPLSAETDGARGNTLVAKVPCRIISNASIATDDGILYDVAHVTEWERNQMTRERRMSAPLSAETDGARGNTVQCCQRSCRRMARAGNLFLWLPKRFHAACFKGDLTAVLA
ncbi:hypothetical protein LSTR_LSTR009303 [Laodelphax striatellus]|uniref:G-protein coupled receptors family 1 profile domain-containing protein n=1 Tax=Laodelphax striatellus TaxID=195883 RepID=A0A482XMR8_LAOST|nr:hypothetical protein LSTR_LSTR009303 [Laodelphax striatellus]